MAGVKTAFAALFACALASAQPYLTFAGKGKHIVLVSGDEEYRSEEMMPQLGRILSKHHGFTTTVLFAMDEDGTVNPNRSDNIPGLETLASADLLILMTRFRDLPDEQMEHIVRYIEAGKPVIGIRTATHAFNPKAGRKHAAWGWRSKEWDGGFGRQVLGETWISHHGKHAVQSTRAMFAPGAAGHPILRGIKDGEIWGPTDVYTVKLPVNGDLLLMGQVLAGMNPSDPAADGKQNDPMMPVAWTRSYKGGRVFTTTMGTSLELQNSGFRRLLVNAAYWALGMEKQIKGSAKVDIVGVYEPTMFGFNKARKGWKPADFAK